MCIDSRTSFMCEPQQIGVERRLQGGMSHAMMAMPLTFMHATALSQSFGDQKGPGSPTSDGLFATAMETRLSSKRKESEKEAAELQAQIVTRSAAKRAKAAGLPTALLQVPKQGASPAAATRSQSQPRTDKSEPNKDRQPRTRASARSRTTENRQRASPRGRSEKRKSIRSEEDRAGPSNADQRQEEAIAQEGSQAEEQMDRQRRSHGDDGHERDSAEDEVCLCVSILARSFIVSAFQHKTVAMSLPCQLITATVRSRIPE